MNAERNKAELKAYLISVGNLALLDKDVHCAKRPTETKGRTDTDDCIQLTRTKLSFYIKTSKTWFYKLPAARFSQ